MTSQHFILATAGHVDHGKSSLVKALTGTDPDRLPEEKARGITIDLGFAHLELESSSARYDVGIVDVPGHEDFVKNMVAGVGSIDLALFVVAADDGWMPQTEEHLQILSYLNVTHAVVALTKIDLAADEAAAIAAICEKLQGTVFAQAPIVPTSVVNGRGISELKQALCAALAQTPPPRDLGKPRLPVDRVFVLRGIGTVITGTLTGGTLSAGQAVVLQPTGKETKVRTVQSHNREVKTSTPGTRTAANVPDVGAATDPDGVQRGQVITLLELGKPCPTLDVALEKSARLIGGKTSAERPLKDGARVRVHLGSACLTARVCLLDAKHLAPGERALAQLRFDEPVFAFAGDRFIVRDWSEQATLAGGLILDPDAGRKNFRTEARRAFLQQRLAAPSDVKAFVATALVRTGAARGVTLLLKSRFSAAEISAAAKDLVARAQAVAAGDWLADAAWWKGVLQKAAALIDAEHKAHPERVGLPVQRLRSALEKELPAPELATPLLAELGRGGFLQIGTAIKRATHRPSLPPNLQAAGARLRAALSAKPAEPPSKKELAPDALSQQALRFLKDTGEVIELSDEVVLLADSFARMRDAIVKHIRDRGPATVSDLRQTLGTTRRIMMPLVERLDKDGVTVRQGDLRSLRNQT
ncbi:MAG: selenocysteine-specific translation elongation factor [Verrucomicrobiota bacterium]